MASHLLAIVGPLGFWEITIILVIVLLVFGPKGLPKLARSLGQAMREFRDAASRMTDSISREAEEDSRRERSRQEDRELPGPSGHPHPEEDTPEETRPAAEPEQADKPKSEEDPESAARTSDPPR